MSSKGETTKTKVVEVKKICNFVVDNFFYLKSSCQEKLYLYFSNLKNVIIKNTIIIYSICY
jgi:hypothetical protein